MPTPANSPNNCEYERRLKQIRQRMREADWNWLNACLGVVEGDPNPVEAYLSSGGDPARQLTPSEVTLLNRPSAFDSGHTLVHLAIRQEICCCCHYYYTICMSPLTGISSWYFS